MGDDLVYELRKVSYGYDPGSPVLREIDLQIRPGEALALLGANGCGKSTLQKLLDGLIFPDAGRISAFGRELTEAGLRDARANLAFRRRVGFVFQDPEVQLFSGTVRDEVAFGPRQFLPAAEAEARTADLLALLDLVALADRPPYTLSGGEQKKVALASVLAVSPDVLILDEPTNGLDPRSQSWVIHLLQGLRAAGKTLVTATHHLGLVPRIADRAVVLGEDHRIIADGTPQKILADRELLIRANLIEDNDEVGYPIETSGGL